MAKVVASVDRNTGELESCDSLMRRFKRAVLNDDILYECKRREYFKPKSLRKKEKQIENLKRAKRRAAKNRKNSAAGER